MTTAVRILVEGNKKVSVCRMEKDKIVEERIIKPTQFETMHIHGDQQIIVQETGEFL